MGLQGDLYIVSFMAGDAALIFFEATLVPAILWLTGSLLVFTGVMMLYVHVLVEWGKGTVKDSHPSCVPFLTLLPPSQVHSPHP